MVDMAGLFGDSEEEDEEQQQQQPQDRSQQAPVSEGLEDEDAEPGDRRPAQNVFKSDEEDDQPTTRKPRSDSDDGSDGERENERKRVPMGPPMEIDAPLLPLPAHNSLSLLRTTNILNLQPRAFDAATFEAEEETYIDETGRARVRLANSAVIRWRMRRLPDGREVRESNARFVRWEDGSMQLLLGDEVLDVAEQDISHNNQYLFVLRNVIQGQAQLRRKLALRPASLDSALHRRLRDHVDKRHGAKGTKVALHGGLDNPELSKAKREAAEEERIKSREALQKKQDRAMARAYAGSRGGRARLSENYLEDDQDWEDGDGEYDYDDGLTADQRARLSLARSRVGEDEEEAARRLQAAKRGAPESRSDRAKRRRVAGSDDEDEELGELPEEEEEEEYQSSGEDEGDEDGEDAGRASKKSKASKGGSQAAAQAAQASKAKARRGVVLSDDEDD